MPSTVDSASEFRVAADAKRCWDFFTDLQNVGSCIPGCESVTLGADKSAVLRVKVSVGYISRTFELKARFTQAVPDSHVSFSGTGGDFEIFGTLDLRPDAQQGTVSVRYSLQVRAVSALGRTAMAMFGKDLVKKQADSFAECVERKLGRPRLDSANHWT